MTHDEIKAVLERVLTWPAERQKDAIAILTTIEASDASPLQLTDDQLAEVRRRRADPDAATMTLTEFEAQLRRFGI
jgi:hypothetical protein